MPADTQTPKKTYRKSLGLFELVSLGVGGTIGSGIFVVPGAAAAVAGVYALFAWAIVAVSATCVVFSLAWLFMRDREDRSFHTLYAEVFGKRIAAGLIVLYLVSSIFGIATIGAGIGQYLGFFGVFPILFIEIAIIALFCGLNLIGIYLSGVTENILTTLKIIPLVVIACALVMFIRPENFVPVNAFGGSSLVAAIILVYWPFTGFEISAIPVEETRDLRLISRSLVLVMAVVIFIYLLLNVSLIGSVGAAVLAASPAPLATAAGLFLPGAAPVVAVVGIIAMLSALNAYIIGASRILQNISSVYRIPVLSEISRRGTPATALVLGSGIAAGALFFSNHFDLLASISVITNLLPYIAFCLAAFLLFHEPMRRAVSGTGIVITSLILVLYFLL